jgi:hypothetical protein
VLFQEKLGNSYSETILNQTVMSTYQNDSNSKSKIIPWLIAGIIALAGTNIATFISKGNTTTQLQAAQVEIKKDEDLNAQLELQFKDATAQLEEMKGKNTELNSLIDKQKEQLVAQKGKISKLINVEKNLNGARAEIARFKAEAEGFITKIAELEQDKKQLGEKVTVLTTEKTSLQENLQKEVTAKNEISAAKAQVETEKAAVEAEKAKLAVKAKQGAVVRVGNISMQGFKVRESGKEKSKARAKNIDRLKFCFKALASPDQDERGTETFYIRIIDPTGVAIATQSGGGGVVKLADDKEVQYTTTKQVEVKNYAEDVCATWDAKGNATLQKGKYMIEIYNKGYLSGKGEFDLK